MPVPHDRSALPKWDLVPSMSRRGGTVLERFTRPARRAVVLSQEEARRLGHREIESDHVLLGVCHELGGLPTDQRPIALTELRAAVSHRRAPHGGPRAEGYLPFTDEAHAAIQAGARSTSAEELVTPQGLLLGVLLVG